MLIISVYDESGVYTNTSLFNSFNDFKKTMPAGVDFSTLADIIELKITGETYADRKNYLYDIALDYSYLDGGGLSYGELHEIQNFFESNGKRYGLLKEFRNNGIC